jgi:glycosyltransferase involved in cell wall biosynthesis
VIKTTIITSLYKAEKYLQGFLKDITRQTVFDECELYLLDAASPEKEYEIIKPYLSEHKNIRYERLDKDPGLYSCWNYMIKNSSSEYITNANTDDKLFPRCIEEHVSFLDKEQQIDLAYCQNATTFDYDTSFSDIKEIRLFPTGFFSPQKMLECNLPHSHPVWRRSIHDDCGYFEEEKYPANADYDFWLNCVSKGKKFSLINKVLGIYFRNPDGLSTCEKDMQRNIGHVMEIREKYSELIK